jgi:hypothetical protein
MCGEQSVRTAIPVRYECVCGVESGRCSIVLIDALCETPRKMLRRRSLGMCCCRWRESNSLVFS